MTQRANQTDCVAAKIKEILDRSNHPTTKYISRLLFQYKLDPSLVLDVLNAAYIRSTKCDKEINNPDAWLKVVCLNIIRELKREQDRHEPIDDDRSPLTQMIHLDHLELDDVFIKDRPIDFYKESLAKAWAALDSDQQLILCMRIIEDKSWKEVAKALSLVNLKPVSESTARQKGHRALADLRKKLG